MHRFLSLFLLAGLALSAPRPQEINLDGVAEADPPTLVAAPLDVVSDIPAPVPTTTVGPITTDTPQRKRRSLEILKRDGDCSPQPTGSGPIPTPDTVSAFLADPDYQTSATSAPTPDGYSLSFSNAQASLSASNYMGLYTLTSFDTLGCASLCDRAAGCQAFNIYIERDPSLDPNAQNCPNPASTINYKCTLWGAPVSQEQATNSGQYRDSFQVVIAGSSGYNKAAPPPAIGGFSGPVGLGGAINAPNSYLGYQYFPFSQSQGYTPSTCAAACQAQTGYDSRHPAADCTYLPCVFFNAYVLSKNGAPQGLYCSLYNATWDSSYGTNYGQYRGSDRYTVSESYSYSLNNPPSQPAYANGCGGSFIQDGDWEGGGNTSPYLGPWTVQTIGDSSGLGGWSPGHTGNRMFGASLYGSNPSPSVLVSQTLSTVPGTSYKFGLWYRFDQGMDTCVINLIFPDSSTNQIILAGQQDFTWYNYQTTFSGGGSELLTINPYCDYGQGGEIFIDDVIVVLNR